MKFRIIKDGYGYHIQQKDYLFGSWYEISATYIDDEETAKKLMAKAINMNKRYEENKKFKVIKVEKV